MLAAGVKSREGTLAILGWEAAAFAVDGAAFAVEELRRVSDLKSFILLLARITILFELRFMAWKDQQGVCSLSHL